MKRRNCFIPAPPSVRCSRNGCSFSANTVNLRPRQQPRLCPGRISPSASTGGWQDAVFGSPASPDAQHPSLPTIDAAFPAKWGELFLLGMCTGSKHVYVTMQTRSGVKGIRSFAAPSSQAMRIPLSSSHERLLIADAFTTTYGTAPPTGSGLSPHSTAFARDLIPAALTRLLGLDSIAVAKAGASVLQEHQQGSPLNRAEATLRLFKTMQVRLAGASLEEVPSLNDGVEVQVRGFLFVEREAAQLYGEIVYQQTAKRIECDPGTAIAVANAARVPCYVRRQLFDAAAMPVRDVQGAFDARGATNVQARWAEDGEGESCPVVFWPEEKKLAPAKPWELKADDVLAMKDDMLRTTLAACDVATTSDESKECLLRKVLDWMDEVERREVGIRLAADVELYGLAGELQRGRSKRGQLLQEMRVAERDGRWGEVMRLNEEVRRIERQTADTTAESGSYSSYLDQDDWYRPNR